MCKRASLRKYLLTLIAVCVLAPAAALAAPSDEPALLSFKSGGKGIRTEWFHPPKKSSKPKPVVLIFCGSGGIQEPGGFFRDLAQSIAESGITTVVVHYMDRSGLKWANNPQMSAHFSEWVQTVHDAVSFATTQPDVDSKRISLLGHSLGSQISLTEAASDTRVHSIVDMAGCFVLSTANVKRMPAVLILNCANDRVVTLRREKGLVTVLKRVNCQYREHIFPGGDHMFDNVRFDTMLDLIVTFLRN
ncbi:MAG TPA: dienelactone hydrolase family protein [Planktothrix sp.]|jgi:dienelactone hydrolase